MGYVCLPEVGVVAFSVGAVVIRKQLLRKGVWYSALRPGRSKAACVINIIIIVTTFMVTIIVTTIITTIIINRPFNVTTQKHSRFQHR